MEIEIRDFRDKQFFQINDLYLNGYAKVCGVYATCIYLSLCRHADKEQSCFPSIKLIAEEFDISEKTVSRAIKKLEDYNIIKKEKKRKGDGKWLNNIYILIDKKYWKSKATPPESPVDSQETLTTQPEDSDDQATPPESPTKDTHTKDTHKKDTHIAEVDLVEVIPELLKDKQRHIQIIGLWAKAKRIEFTSKEHQSSFIRRNLRAARDLVAYPDEKIIETMQYLILNADFKIVLSTVGKYIDEDLHSLALKKTKTLEI